MSKIDRARQLKEDGVSVEDIAKELNVSAESAKRYLRAYGTGKNENRSEKMPTDVKRILTDQNHTLDSKIKTLKLLKHSNDQINGWVSEMGELVANSQFANAKVRKLKKSDRYIVTSAQNNTPTNEAFLRKMKIFAEHVGAEIIVIPTRYKNPTAVEKSIKYTWDKDLEDYLYASDLKLHKRLLIKAGLKIQATSSNPTGGVNLMGNGASVITGSPQIQMKSLPVLPDSMNIFAYSTGTVSYPNMSDTVAGGKAEAHHSFGFILVEIESDEVVHCHNISATRNGDFSFFNVHVGDNGVGESKIDAMVWGDIHLAHRHDGMINLHKRLHEHLNIDTAILHDVFDSTSCSRHLKDDITRFAIYDKGKSNLENELNEFYEFLDWFEMNLEKTYVVRSNHDSMIDSTIRDISNHFTSENAIILSKLLTYTLENINKEGGFKGIIPELVNSKYKNIIGLGYNDSLVINRVECGNHGDKGSSGSRGSINQFKNLAFKTTTAHSHKHCIAQGARSVGHISQWNHGYNEGLSEWSWGSEIIFNTGKRQEIVFNKQTMSFSTFLKFN